MDFEPITDFNLFNAFVRLKGGSGKWLMAVKLDDGRIVNYDGLEMADIVEDRPATADEIAAHVEIEKARGVVFLKRRGR